jgi:CubicO group peptidase (beta-lactamase class C family)
MPDTEKKADQSAETPAKKTGIAALDDLFQPFNRSDMPGLVVGVAHHGKTIYRRGFGLASVQHGIINTPATRMRIGSTSKHFTCLAALLLAEDGKLDVDAPANTYLPELPTLEGMPTLRQFMMHTSGYRCSLDLSTLGNGMALSPTGWHLKTLVRQREVNFKPNHGQMYCNGGYHLLSIAIDRVAGMSYEQFLKTRILEPLGMHDTEGNPSDQLMLPGLAALHLPIPGGGWRRGSFGGTDIRGEGNMVSTVDDMLRWLAHLNGPKIVGNAETWRQMFEPATLANGLKSVYSLGLNRHAYRNVEVIQHSGGVVGGNSQMITVPKHGLDIAIMVNGAPASAAELAFKVIDAILGDDVLGAPATPLASLERFRHLVGASYHGPSGMLLGFGEAGDKLGLRFMHSQPFPILRDEGHRLFAGFEHVAIGPLELDAKDLAANGDGNAPDTITLVESGYPLVLHRVPATAPAIKDVGKALVGTYASNDLAATAVIEFEDDNLVMRLRGDYSAEQRILVDAYSTTAFGLRDPEAIGMGTGLTIEGDIRNGLAPAFRVDSLRARHVRFDRVSAA